MKEEEIREGRGDKGKYLKKGKKGDTFREIIRVVKGGDENEEKRDVAKKRKCRRK